MVKIDTVYKHNIFLQVNCILLIWSLFIGFAINGKRVDRKIFLYEQVKIRKSACDSMSFKFDDILIVYFSFWDLINGEWMCDKFKIGHHARW